MNWWVWFVNSVAHLAMPCPPRPTRSDQLCRRSSRRAPTPDLDFGGAQSPATKETHVDCSGAAPAPSALHRLCEGPRKAPRTVQPSPRSRKTKQQNNGNACAKWLRDVIVSATLPRTPFCSAVDTAGTTVIRATHQICEIIRPTYSDRCGRTDRER